MIDKIKEEIEREDSFLDPDTLLVCLKWAEELEKELKANISIEHNKIEKAFYGGKEE